MKKLLVTAPVVLSLFSCVTTEKRAPGVAVDVPVSSKYVFRGVTFVDGPVTQPSFNATLPTKRETGFLVFESWNNIDLTNDTNGPNPENPGGPTPPFEAIFPEEARGEITENRQLIGWKDIFGVTEFYGGVQTYHWDWPSTGAGPFLPGGLDNNGNPTGFFGDNFIAELFTRFVWDFSGWRPHFELRYEFDAIEDFYANIGIMKAFRLSNAFDLRAELALGYAGKEQAQFFYGVDTAGFADLRGTLGFDWRANKHTTVRADFSASTLLEDDYRDFLGDTPAWDINPDPSWFTIGANWAF